MIRTVVIIVEKAEPSLRGALSRWMIQPRTGVFVGRISARVRDRLWERVTRSSKVRGALCITPAQNEQGFEVRSWGDNEREPVDFDGLTLIRRPGDSHTQTEHFRKRGRVPQSGEDVNVDGPVPV